MQKLKKNRIVFMLYTRFRRLLSLVSPRLNTLVTYRISKGRPANLKSPKSLDEKISWLKLNIYNKDPLIAKCTDKYAVREYISSCGLSETLNDLYGVYNRVEDINWEDLPDKFVLKWNNGNGLNVFCYDKKTFDIENAVKLLKKWEKAKKYLNNAEMQYKHIPPKIVCEKLIEVKGSRLPDDYKFYCFNGRAEYCMVCVERETGSTKFYHYDREWNFALIHKENKNIPADFRIQKPQGLDRMLQYADILAKPFPFVRVDFYNVDGKIIFGELTFTPFGGINSSLIEEMDLMLGNMLKLPDMSH
jgi:hypothetical protein